LSQDRNWLKERYTPFDVTDRTGVAAETLHQMFGWDEHKLVADMGPKFQALHDALAEEHLETDEEVETLPDLWVVDEAGLTLSGVVRGHDKLTGKDGQGIPETFIWPEMWRGRNADYLNRRALGEQLSAFGQVPLVALGMVLGGTRGDSPGLHLNGENWENQQIRHAGFVERHNSAHSLTVAEGMNPIDWLVVDGQRVVKGQPRLDDLPTVTCFVQNDQDVTVNGCSYGPSAAGAGSQSELDGSNGGPLSGVGARFLVGQKPQVFCSSLLK